MWKGWNQLPLSKVLVIPMANTDNSLNPPVPDPPDHKSISELLNDPINSEAVKLISRSKYATYPKAWNVYQKIVNIQNVKQSKKMIDTQYGKTCPILASYKNLMESEKENLTKALTALKDDIDSALSNYQKESQSQRSVKDFFRPITGPSDKTPKKDDNLQKANAACPQNHPTATEETKSTLSGLFKVLNIHASPANIEETIKIDKTLMKSTETVQLIKTFYKNKEDFERKSVFQHRASAFLENKQSILNKLGEFKSSFNHLHDLCDKTKNMELAQTFPFAEMGTFLNKRLEEATLLGKELFLRLNSGPFKAELKKMNHEYRKRFSYLGKEVDKSLHICCHNAENSWEECLQKIHDNWIPNNSNGNVTIGNLETCRNLFAGLEIRGDHYIPSNTLLDWLGIESTRALALKTILENLPIIQIKKGFTSILMSVTSFLSSKDMLEDMMKVVQEQSDKTTNKDGTILKRPGEDPDTLRKEGSGRKRIVEENPRILEAVQNFAENAGVAAHIRRRENVGLFGFSMKDLQNMLSEMIFNGKTENAPSIKTLRRLFEAPSQASNSKRYYKAYIKARPGTKANNAPAGGKRHSHQHECFTTVRHIREFFSLHQEECVTMSCDNKCKIPCGTPCVNRLTSLKSKFFLTSQGPDHADHDLRTGRLIVPEGYQILTHDEKFEDSDTDDDGEELESGQDTSAEEIPGLSRKQDDLNNNSSENATETDAHNNSTDTCLDNSRHTSVDDMYPRQDSFFSTDTLLEGFLDDLEAEKENPPKEPLVEHEKNDSKNSQPSTVLDLNGNVAGPSTSGFGLFAREDDPFYSTDTDFFEMDLAAFSQMEKDHRRRKISPQKQLNEDPPPKKKDATEKVNLKISPEKQLDENSLPNEKDDTEKVNMKISPQEQLDDGLKLEEDLEPFYGHNYELTVDDAITQLDGGNSESDSDEFGVEDIFKTRASKKRRIVLSDDELDSNSSNEEEDSGEDDQTDEVITTKASFNKNNVTRDKSGREHISYPSTGPCYIFLKSNRARPSSISAHVNDIITIYEAHSGLKSKPNLALLLDDGIDWGMRGLQTFYFFGYLWKTLNLDLLAIGRNAPGDSKWNPIERLWSYITAKLAGLVVPDFGKEMEDDEADEAGIKFLIDSAMTNLKYDGFDVVTVPVSCHEDNVIINGETVDNRHIKPEDANLIQKIMEDRKMNKKLLKNKQPQVAENLKIFYKHADVRQHNIIIRKCHPLSPPCRYCKDHPVRSSDQFWSCLPNKKKGGLFFDCEEDTQHPGHYRTLLDLLEDISEVTIKPDGQFTEVKRCEVRGCLYSFKSDQDAQRHCRLAHGILGPKVQDHICRWKVEGVACGQVFTTKWKLTKHKNSSGHKKKRLM